MKHHRSVTMLFALVVVSGCQSPTETATMNDVEQVATEFFATFADRTDWEKLLSFYSPEMQFEDLPLGDKNGASWPGNYVW